MASIKLSTGGGGGPEAFRPGAIQATPGNLVMRGVRFSAAVRWACSLQDYQVTGPARINEQRYDIVAKADGPAPESQLRLMAQALLAGRFKLTFHRQTKEMQALANAGKECHCTPAMIQRYLGKISGPLLDRIDMHIEVPAVAFVRVRRQQRHGHPSQQVRDLIQLNAISTGEKTRSMAANVQAVNMVRTGSA